MKIEEKDILYHTILHSCEYKDNGLMYGKMGVALSLAMYAKVHNCKPVEDFADELLDSVLLNLSKHTTLGFGQGLAGIGWGIEYLTQNGFLQIDTTEICKEIDEQIMQINIEKMSDMSLENGLLGLLTYINAHIYGNKGKRVFSIDFLKQIQKISELRAGLMPQPVCEQLVVFKHINSTLFGNLKLRLEDYVLCEKINLNNTDNLSLRNGYAGQLVIMNSKTFRNNE